FSVQCAAQSLDEKRRISEKQVAQWFDAESSSYAKAMSAVVSPNEWDEIKNLLLCAIDKQIFSWRSEIAFFSITKKYEKIPQTELA
ncbi:MAG: hypothetical protein II811_02890, partial [Spirochaetaceae bacterium]|nr:hypothetical protein [Spirochaetaceae bacterium]